MEEENKDNPKPEERYVPSYQKPAEQQDPLDRISGPEPLSRISGGGDPLDQWISQRFGRRRRR